MSVRGLLLILLILLLIFKGVTPDFSRGFL